MKKLVLAGLAAATMIGAAASADAARGCGAGFHRGYYGRCIPNRSYGYGPRGPAIGVFYPGRGYWYGGRYWGHRYRWHGGWRYR
jgi:hypothetical protein